MSIVKRDSFRSEGTLINKTDDMYRVVVEMTRGEFIAFSQWAARQNTKESPENSPASPVQHAQAEISLAVDRYDAMSEFDFLSWVRSRLPKWRKLSATGTVVRKTVYMEDYMSELKEVFDNDELLNGYLENVKLTDFRAEVRQLVEENGSSHNSDIPKFCHKCIDFDKLFGHISGACHCPFCGAKLRAGA